MYVSGNRMAKSKKRKASIKGTKRRLVFELLPTGMQKVYYPKLMLRRSFWQGEVTFENDFEGEVYAITSSSPLRFGEFLIEIHEELQTLVPNDSVNCSIKVFLRCKSS